MAASPAGVAALVEVVVSMVADAPDVREMVEEARSRLARKAAPATDAAPASAGAP